MAIRKSKSKKNKSRARRGMVIELDKEDIDALERLMERYQENIGSSPVIRKVHVIRQLIRRADELKWLPPEA